MEQRVRELERRMIAAEDRIAGLESRLADAMREQYQMGSLLGRGGSDGGASGSYYADPGAVTIAPETSETLTVFEVRSSGPVDMGERIVWNVLPDATIEVERILLNRNGDGSFTVYQQACPPEEEA